MLHFYFIFILFFDKMKENKMFYENYVKNTVEFLKIQFSFIPSKKKAINKNAACFSQTRFSQTTIKMSVYDPIGQ